VGHFDSYRCGCETSVCRSDFAGRRVPGRDSCRAVDFRHCAAGFVFWIVDHRLSVFAHVDVRPWSLNALAIDPAVPTLT
jgi:hypothetical protein